MKTTRRGLFGVLAGLFGVTLAQSADGGSKVHFCSSACHRWAYFEDRPDWIYYRSLDGGKQSRMPLFRQDLGGGVLRKMRKMPDYQVANTGAKTVRMFL